MTRPNNGKLISPFRVIVLVSASIFIGESIIMLALDMLHSVPSHYEILLDALVLTVFAIPILYFFLYRPLTYYIEALQESKDELDHSMSKLNAIVSTANDAIITIDCDGVVTSINSATSKIFGYSEGEIIGKSITLLMTGLDVKHHNRYVKSFEETGKKKIIGIGRETTAIRKGGEVFPISLSVNEFSVDGERGYAGIIRDISDSKAAEEKRIELEEHLTRSQKIEALGNLSGGIAHDFNNILSIISSNAEMMALQYSEDPKIMKHVNKITQASDRAVGLTTQILTFSRMDKSSLEDINFSDIVVEAVEMIRSTIPSYIDIDLNIDDHNGFIHGNATQIHQVVLNLCTNAYHAIDDAKGKISISISQPERCSSLYCGNGDADDCRCIVLTVSDTGCGISQENQRKIFDPFYTTKEVGKGTGLGLAVIHGIVKGHEGHIAVESEVGKGTTFRVCLPCLDEQIVQANTPDDKREGGDSSGAGHILIVDDEEDITDAFESYLEMQGFDVTTCADGADAFAIFSENPDDFDLLLTDHSVPNLTGKQLCEKIQHLKSDLPIIMMSGKTTSFSEEGSDLGIQEYLLKPVKLSVLNESISRHITRH